jgi:hypothetical protein
VVAGVVVVVAGVVVVVGAVVVVVFVVVVSGVIVVVVGTSVVVLLSSSAKVVRISENSNKKSIIRLVTERPSVYDVMTHWGYVTPQNRFVAHLDLIST